FPHFAEEVANRDDPAGLVLDVFLGERILPILRADLASWLGVFKRLLRIDLDHEVLLGVVILEFRSAEAQNVAAAVGQLAQDGALVAALEAELTAQRAELPELAAPESGDAATRAQVVTTLAKAAATDDPTLDAAARTQCTPAQLTAQRTRAQRTRTQCTRTK